MAAEPTDATMDEITYKVVNSEQLDYSLKTIADAIRSKGGTSAPLAFPNGMAQAIADIEAGGAGGNYNIESVDDGNVGQILNITDAGGSSSDIVTPWFTVKTAEVTIGANSVNNPQTAVAYFEGIVGEKRLMSAFLKTEKESYGTNELVSFAPVGSHTDNSNANQHCSYRYRNNQLGSFALSSGYSCYLYEGATYVVLYYENRP